MEDCNNCEHMPEGYYCQVCGQTGKQIAEKRGKPSEFTYQWYAVSVRITGTEPVQTYRHGPRKGEPKGTAWTKTLYDSPTHYYNYNVQGIRTAAHCENIVRESFRLMVAALESLGYTDVRVVVSAVGVYF